MAKHSPTHFIISIDSVENELIRLKAQLSSPSGIFISRELIQGKIEAYTAIMMQEKVTVPLKPFL